jgi:hypothetical protein
VALLRVDVVLRWVRRWAVAFERAPLSPKGRRACRETATTTATATAAARNATTAPRRLPVRDREGTRRAGGLLTRGVWGCMSLMPGAAGAPMSHSIPAIGSK